MSSGSPPRPTRQLILSQRNDLSAAVEQGLLAKDAVDRLDVAWNLLPQLVGSVNGLLVLVAGCPSRRRGVSRNVSMALMVRIANLFDSLLALGPRYESALILLRCLTESAIDLIYLEKSSDRAKVAQRFKKASLYEDRLILTALDQHEPTLDGARRMMGSLLGEATKNLSGVRLARRNHRIWSNDASIEARARRIAREDLYDHVYRPLSSCVHGRWAALAALDLQVDDGGSWTPRLDDGRFHIGFAITSCWIALQAGDAYLGLAGTSGAVRLRESVSEFIDLVEELDRMAGGDHRNRRPLGLASDERTTRQGTRDREVGRPSAKPRARSDSGLET